ncbi:MAG: hypothetical protein V8R46_08500 [Eubacterium ramulus]
MKKDKKTESRRGKSGSPEESEKEENGAGIIRAAGSSLAQAHPWQLTMQKVICGTETPSPKTESADTTAEDTAETTALETPLLDLPDGIYEGTGTGFAGKDHSCGRD